MAAFHNPVTSVYTTRFRLFVTLTVCVLLQFARPALGQSDIVSRVLQHYSELETLQARFDQTMTSDLFDEPEEISGSLFMRGKAYRILTGTRTIVTDGDTSWIYDPIEKQVLIDNQIEDEMSFSVHQFLYAFDERFDVAGTVRSGNSWQIELSPRDPDDYFRHLELIVRDADALITEIRVDDINEVSIRIQLSEITENPDLDDALFRFDVPAGAEVVDLRSD
ncbi:MAG: outer membrane lipoprotein carrier protein LolA [Rhodothermales bacterium]|nr:outer membrane lipoprotein carrier protein LolA [Rhodothermales bacterium]